MIAVLINSREEMRSVGGYMYMPFTGVQNVAMFSDELWLLGTNNIEYVTANYPGARFVCYKEFCRLKSERVINDTPLLISESWRSFYTTDQAQHVTSWGTITTT